MAQPRLFRKIEKRTTQHLGPGRILQSSGLRTGGLREKRMAGERESSSDNGADNHVAQKVHAEQDARYCNAESAEQQCGQQSRVELAQRDGDGKRGDRVARGKRELIGRQQLGPAMRFDFARAFAAENFFSEVKMPTPTMAADPAEAIAVNRSLPPNSKIDNPVRYQSQPSPARVAAMAQTRIHFGARHLLTLRISRWSRVAIKCSMLWWAVKAVPS